MKVVLKYLSIAVMLALFFVVGLKAGPLAARAYHKVFPPQTMFEGDWSAATAGSSTQLVIFTTSTCPYCKHLREYLDGHKIPYTDYVTDKSEDAQKRYGHLKSDGVPVTVIGRKKFVGFDDKTASQILAELKVSAAPSAL